jgi:tetratricopeptide (TPR) repeat protein
VAKKLRRAIFYSKGSNIDIREANKYFRQALQVAADLGMDPFSPEILGVKYAVSHLFEQAGHYPLACDVLEIMRVDCERFVREFGDKHWTDGDRTRVLKVIVQLDVKLGQLYESKYMNQPEDAEKRLVEAVETALREKQRREVDGVKEGEGEWLTDEEMGGTLEALGSYYEANDMHYLATPLFVQALTLVPPTSCHGVVLSKFCALHLYCSSLIMFVVNNISTCLAQQTPPPAALLSKSSTTPSFPSAPAPSREVLVDQAKQWANKALALAAQIKPPERNEECDVGCAVATHNLGEFFEMEGRIQEARQRYKEAESLSKAIGFADGQVNAQSGLKRLKGLDGSNS